MLLLKLRELLKYQLSPTKFLENEIVAVNIVMQPPLVI